MTRKIWMFTNLRKCPYCGGGLVRSKARTHHYDCTECDRGWIINFKESRLHAVFDAGHTTAQISLYRARDGNTYADAQRL